MSSSGFDPTRLDVRAFAAEAGELEGRWPLRSLARFSASAAAETPPGEADEVEWKARGESRAGGTSGEIWLHLQATTAIALQCQRCLAPLRVEVDFARRFLFVSGEDAAANIDATQDDDVLALTRALDLRELVEDELLLALPLVPRHETCPVPLPRPAAEEAEAERSNPFAALAGLKRGLPPG